MAKITHRNGDVIAESDSQSLLELANKKRADLRGANLRGAYLRGAYLRGADLQGANLRGADLRGANLQGAYLRGADLQGADLLGANLQGAYLRGADLQSADLPAFQIPQTGSIEVFKKVASGVVIKLLIPADARRTATLVGRKCRAEYAITLEGAGDPIASRRGDDVMYHNGMSVRPDKYCDDIRVECSHGIHFFLTREEAENY